MQAIVKELKERNAEQAEQIADLIKQLQMLEAENKILKQKNDFLLHRLFGCASEKFDAGQLELLLGIPEAEVLPRSDVSPHSSTPRQRSKRTRKPRIPDNLPTEDIVIEPEAVRLSPDAYKMIGEEITQEIDVIPPVYFRRRYIRRKYTSLLDRAMAPIIAPLPARLIEGGYGSAGLVTDIILRKYVDHIPLYRQEQILRTRHGIELPRKTMSDWMGIAANWLKPIYNHARDDLRKSGYLQIDETPVRYCQTEGGGSGQGYLWVYHHPPGGTVLYEWHTGRGSDCLDEMLDGFSGTVQCDGYKGYTAYAKRHEAIDLAACWAHARRKIYEARDETPQLAGWLLNQIGHMYRIESELREKKAGPRLRQAVRSAESGMFLTRIGKALERKKAAYLPRGQMGEAIAYALGLWKQLLKFRDDGRLEIDNNGVENAIRPTAVGKKNWLFIGHPDAGERSAILYTILENCKRRGINPEVYLRDVLTRLPSLTNRQTQDLTPARWLAARKAKAA